MSGSTGPAYRVKYRLVLLGSNWSGSTTSSSLSLREERVAACRRYVAGHTVRRSRFPRSGYWPGQGWHEVGNMLILTLDPVYRIMGFDEAVMFIAPVPVVEVGLLAIHPEYHVPISKRS